MENLSCHIFRVICLASSLHYTCSSHQILLSSVTVPVGEMCVRRKWKKEYRLGPDRQQISSLPRFCSALRAYNIRCTAALWPFLERVFLSPYSTIAVIYIVNESFFSPSLQVDIDTHNLVWLSIIVIATHFICSFFAHCSSWSFFQLFDRAPSLCAAVE